MDDFSCGTVPHNIPLPHTPGSLLAGLLLPYAVAIGPKHDDPVRTPMTLGQMLFR